MHTMIFHIIYFPQSETPLHRKKIIIQHYTRNTWVLWSLATDYWISVHMGSTPTPDNNFLFKSSHITRQCPIIHGMPNDMCVLNNSTWLHPRPTTHAREHTLTTERSSDIFCVREKKNNILFLFVSYIYTSHKKKKYIIKYFFLSHDNRWVTSAHGHIIRGHNITRPMLVHGRVYWTGNITQAMLVHGRVYWTRRQYQQANNITRPMLVHGRLYWTRRQYHSAIISYGPCEPGDTITRMTKTSRTKI